MTDNEENASLSIDDLDSASGGTVGTDGRRHYSKFSNYDHVHVKGRQERFRVVAVYYNFDGGVEYDVECGRIELRLVPESNLEPA